MTGPGGDEVARVSVRVVPNSDDFKRDLERQLRSLRDEEIRIPVKLDLDKADLERQLRELDTESINIPVNFKVDDIRDDVKRATAGANADAIEVPAHIDESGLQAELARINEQIDHLSTRTATPHVELLLASFEAQKREVEASIAELERTRVEIPVGVDTSEAVREAFNLKAILDELDNDTVQIQFDLQDAALQRKIAEVEAVLAEFDGQEVTADAQVKIDEALLQLVRLRRELEALDGKRIEAIANLDVNTLRADARIAAFIAAMKLRRKIEIPVDVDDRSLVDVDTRIGRVFRGLGDQLATFFDGIGSSISGIVGNIPAIAKGLAAGVVVAGQFTAMLGLAAGISAGLVVAGAGITAAWGAAATAISAVPAALALIGAPAAAVALGLDGIKKAAAGIKPELDKLKASISTVFEQGLTPILKNIATKVFPDLTTGLQGTARALIDLAGGITDVVVRATQFGQIKVIFDNVNTALRNIQPGIQDLVTGFLLLAQQSGVFDALVAAVNTFGQAFKNNVIATINDGSLAAAFTGLKGTLVAVTQGFADLVKNGIELFSKAAPGVNSFINDLTGFFNRFDWQNLGTSVGGVFRGLGEAIRGIPQSTILAIQGAFQRLSDTFQSNGFQRGIQIIAQGIPGVITALDLLIQSFLRVGLAATGFVQVIMGVARTIATIGDALLHPIDLINGKYKAAFDQASAEVNAGFRNIGAAFSSFNPTVPSVAPALQAGIFTPLHEAAGFVQAEFDKLGVNAGTSLRNMDVAIQQGTANWANSAKTGASAIPPAVGAELDKTAPAASAALGQVPPAAETALAPLQQLEALKAMEPQFTTAAAASMHAMSVGVQSGMAEVQQQFTTGLDSVTTNLNSSFTQKLALSVQSGMSLMAAQVTAGMPQIQAAFNFEGIGVQIGNVFLGLVGTFSLGMASLANTVLGGMPQIQAAFNFEGITTQIGTVFLGLVGTFSLGMASLAATVTAGIPLIQAAFNFTGLQVQIGNVFLGMVGTFNLGMASLAAAVTAGMVGIQAAFNFTGLQTQIGAFFLGLVGTFNLGMSSLAASVTAGMSQIQAAFNFTGVAAQIGAVFLGLVGTFNRGMASLAAAVAAGMSGVQAAFNFTGIQAQASAGMQGITSTIQAGMATAVAAVDSGVRLINGAMANLTTSVASSVAGASGQFRSLGTAAQQAGQTMNAAMLSMTAAVRAMQAAVTAAMSGVVAAVQSGVARAQAAAQGATGAFRSAGANMGQALADGLNSKAGAVQAAANRLAQAAAAAVRAAAQIRSPSRVFMEIGSFMGEGLALGMEGSSSRVAAAADAMADAAVGAVDRMESALSSDALAGKLSANVAHSFSDLSGSSSQAMLGQQRVANGELTQSTALLAAIVSELREIRAAAGRGGDSVITATASSRRTAELGAF